MTKVAPVGARERAVRGATCRLPALSQPATMNGVSDCCFGCGRDGRREVEVRWMAAKDGSGATPWRRAPVCEAHHEALRAGSPRQRKGDGRWWQMREARASRPPGEKLLAPQWPVRTGPPFGR